MQKPSPTPVCGKIVFHKTSPWCQKVGDCCTGETLALTVTSKEEGDNLSFLAKGLGEKPLMSGSKQEGGGAVELPAHIFLNIRPCAILGLCALGI